MKKFFYEPGLYVSNTYMGQIYIGITASWEEVNSRYPYSSIKELDWAFRPNMVWIHWLNRPSCPSNEIFWNDKAEITFFSKDCGKALEILYGKQG